MNDESIKRLIDEAASNGADDASDKLSIVHGRAWEGLMRAVEYGESQLTNVELAHAISDAAIEVLTSRGMSAKQIASVFHQVCEQWDSA